MPFGIAPELFILLLLVGGLGGFLSGLLGIGGGIVYVVVLQEVLKQHGVQDTELVRFTLANSIAVIFFAGLTAIVRQLRKKTLDVNATLTTGIAGAITAGLLAYLILGKPWYKPLYFNMVYITMLAYSLYRMLVRKAELKLADIPVVDAPINTKKLIVPGLLTGALSALSGLGGGIVLVPMLMQATGMKQVKASLLSLGTIACIALVLICFYAFGNPVSKTDLGTGLGYLLPSLMVPLVIGVVFTTSFGIRIAANLHPRALKWIFAGMASVLLVKKCIEVFL